MNISWLSTHQSKGDDWMFFMYDNSTLKTENDFIGDSIIYFSPSTIPENVRILICAQLVGINEFFKSFTGSSVTTFCLQDAKVAVKHVEQYTLGLSRNIDHANTSLHKVLDSLYDHFRFFHGSFEIFRQVCSHIGKDFVTEVSSMWDCYLSFIKRYGETVCAGFSSIPSLHISGRVNEEIYGICSEFLQEVGSKLPLASLGCILFNNQVACSQLSTELTSRLGIIRPRQQNLPCQLIKTDFVLPQGVRLYSVFLTRQEVESLNTHVGEESSVISKMDVKEIVYDFGETVQKDELNDCSKSVFNESSKKFHFNKNESDFMNDKAISKNEPLIVQPSNNAFVNCMNPNGDLFEMNLYIHGCSDMLFVLLIPNEMSTHPDIVYDLWKKTMQQMARIETMITKASYTESNMLDRQFNYLVFDESKRLLIGDTVYPVSSEEYDFCRRSIIMNEELHTSPETTEIVLRTHHAVYAGIRDGDLRLHCQKQGVSATGRSTNVSAFSIAKMKHFLHQVMTFNN